MSIRPRLVRLCVLFALLTSFIFLPPRSTAAQNPMPWGDKSTPFGAVVSLGNRVRADEMPTMIRLMLEAGVQWNREEISWDQVQFTPNGPYRWAGDAAGFFNYDRAIQLQDAAGIKILGLLAYNPLWFKGKNPRLEEWLDDWGDYVYNTVARYGRDRNQIKYWEIWNEPNLALAGYDSGLYTPNHYVQILATANAAAKRADPEAVIVLGALCDVWSELPANFMDTPEYLQEIARLGAWQYFDILAIHPYRPGAPEIPALRRDRYESLLNQMDGIDAILNQWGRKPIWYTEMGWSLEYHGARDDLEQAAWMQRFYLLTLSRPGVEKIFWYDFRDDTDGPGTYTNPLKDPNNNQFHFGLLRRTYPLRFDDPTIRKPGYSAFIQLTNTIGGLGFQSTQDDPYDANGVAWQRWSNAERTLDVLWWIRPEETPPYVTINCDCNTARVRAYDGQLKRVLRTNDGVLKIQPPQDGTPIWVERGGDRTIGRRFSETPYTITGIFRTYWDEQGGLAQFGLPITNEVLEPGPGRIPTVVQYFERNRFEWHPYNPSQFRVLLSLLGEATLKQNGTDWRTLPPAPQPTPDGCTYFAETGHSLCWPFKAYWEKNGGVALYGFPLTEAFWEYDPDRGVGQYVQYFERNRLEHSPEYSGTPYEMQLGLLGQQLYGGWGVWP